MEIWYDTYPNLNLKLALCKSCPWVMHTCHKLWTKICEIRQNFKWDLTKFCEIFLNITLELPHYSLKFSFSCKKLVKTTKMWDLCLFLHKISCKMVWKFCEIWTFYGNCLFRLAKFCDILSHSVRYGMYGHALGWGYMSMFKFTLKFTLILMAHFYICIFLGGHNLGTSYAGKWKFGMILTQT